MLDCIKKSFIALINNCHLPLALTAYFILFAIFTVRFFTISDILIFGISIFLFVIFSLFFFSGWFKALSATLDEENKENFFELFKSGIKKYFLPFLNSAFLFVLIFILVNFLGIIIADKFIGKVDFLRDIVEPGKYNLDAIISSLSQEQIEILFKRELLFIICAFLMHSMALFWVPAIYSKDNANIISFRTLKSSLFAFFKKPFVTMSLTLFSNIIILSYMSAPLIFGKNIFFLLLNLIIFSCWAVFILMLIFSYYEKTFANNCNNGADCIGEEQDCN